MPFTIIRDFYAEEFARIEREFRASSDGRAATQARTALLDRVVLDLSRVARIDFVSAGALVNAVQRLQAQRKAVEIVGASAILRALLLLVGMAPDLLARRAV